MDGDLGARTPFTRRMLTRAAGAAVAGTAVAAATAGPAEARAAGYRPRPYRRTPVPDARTLHLLQRFTGGYSYGLLGQVKAAGGIDKWFAKQLSPTSLPDSFYNGSAAWWPSNTMSTAQLWQRDQANVEGIWEANANYQRWSLVRRMYSERHVVETMAAFWEHHFNVPANGDAQGLFRADYGRMIRRMALGKFSDLLLATTTHPSMGCYLGNAQSTKRAPNENLGRELLELHTITRSAGYGEDDVKASARILTGYRVDTWNTWEVKYDPNSHWTGAVKVLGFTHPNTDADGRAVTTAYLRYLAHHPNTARNIARKLAVRFVSDAPSAGLVEYLARVYLANDTAIVPVLRALVSSNEFKGAALRKVRTPDEDVIASHRALRAQIARPNGDGASANAILWLTNTIGSAPFGWPRPDGRPDYAEAWTSVSRMLGSFEVHQNLAGGWWPKQAVTYRRPGQWLPQPRIRFDQFVDHLCRVILGRRSTPTLLRACCEAAGVRPGAVITRNHGVIKWEMPRLLVVLLDNPYHLSR